MTTLLTDGTPVAKAVAQWLSELLVPSDVVEAHGAADIDRIARRLPMAPIVISSSSPLAGPDATRVLEIAAGWLSGLAPIEQRAEGARRIEANRRAREPGAEELERLLQRLSIIRPPLVGGRRRGRPPGIDPFHGVGMAICVELLGRHRGWTERDLAKETGAAPSSVHRALVELDRRGYVARRRGASTIVDGDRLRRDLAVAWAARRRPGVRLRCRGADVRGEFLRLVGTRSVPFVAAGSSAIDGNGILGEPFTVYADADDPAALLADAFDPSPRLGDLLVLTPPDPAVFLSPREVQGLPATNRLVTWLDLHTSGSERHREAAEAFWENTDAA